MSRSKSEIKFSAFFIGDITRYLFALNFLLVLLWWKFAITESERKLGPHLYKGPCCSCPMFTNRKLQYGCTTAYNNASIPLSDDWKWYRRRRDLFTIHYSDLQVLAPLKLLLCGDVETNPGPGEYVTLDSVYIQASVCAIKCQLELYIHSMWANNIPTGNDS